MSVPTVGELVRLYDLKPHPEGGFYKETYRAAGTLPSGRNYSTAIFYLLPAGTRSRLHWLKSDETFHFYLGGPMALIEITPAGATRKTVMGHDVASGASLQHVVKAGNWFGAYPEAGSAYCLVGCTVAPGFDFADFTVGERKELLKLFPDAREVVERLTD